MATTTYDAAIAYDEVLTPYDGQDESVDTAGRYTLTLANVGMVLVKGPYMTISEAD